MRFSVIIPVLNEEAALEAHLQHLVARCTQKDCEILIVDGGSSDQTVAIGSIYGEVLSAPRGRARQMNAGAAHAQGAVLLFLHADTFLPEQAFEAIEYALKRPKIVGGAFQICFNCQLWPYRFVAATTNLRSRLRGIFTGDQTYFVRAEAFQAIGGFPDQPLMEDLEIVKRLRTLGRMVLLSPYVTTSARRHEQLGLLRSVLWMWWLRTLYFWGLSPERLRQMYADIR